MKYIIIEVANTHGGNLDYLERLIDSFEKYREGFGMKFQPFSFDTLATPDYPWYSTYQELFFDSSQWKGILDRASKTKDIWLDLFDTYGVRILNENIDKIKGIKFQASVLYNAVLINELSSTNLKDKVLIVNISSIELEEIGRLIQYINEKLSPAEIVLEVGFQAYPTRLEDSGLNKIAILKSKFSNRIVFADHLDGSSEDALWFPVIAGLKGADIIEKHVMLSREETKYDHFSSLSPDRFELLIGKAREYLRLDDQLFINEKEKEYLAKSIMVPIVRNARPAGTLLNMVEDLEYKRSGKEGLNAKQVEDKQQNFHLLSIDKHPGQTLKAADFKKANIATIIACRLKSTRLTKKALLKIGDLTSVEFCLKNAMRFDNVNSTILATSTVEEDAPLVNYTYSPSVIFHTGDPDDVIQRYLDATRKYKIDVIIRVTADMPFIDNEICQLLLKKHFENGADYTVGKEAAVGTNLEIISVQALEKVKSFFPRADYSEYMTWYFQNNPEHFRLQFVELPKELVRDYRLTLDHQEDLEVFNAVHEYFTKEGKEEYSLRDIYAFLDANPEVAAMNQHITLKYRTDSELINTLNKVTKIA